MISPSIFLYGPSLDIDQLKLILRLVGTPGPELLKKISSESVSLHFDCNICPFRSPKFVCCSPVVLSVECVGIYFLLFFFLCNSLLLDGFKFLCFVYLIFIPLTSAHGMISSFHILILLLRDFSLSLWVYAL